MPILKVIIGASLVMLGSLAVAGYVSQPKTPAAPPLLQEERAVVTPAKLTPSAEPALLTEEKPPRVPQESCAIRFCSDAPGPGHEACEPDIPVSCDNPQCNVGACEVLNDCQVVARRCTALNSAAHLEFCQRAKQGPCR